MTAAQNPGRLKLEITEGALLQNPEASVDCYLTSERCA